MDHQKLKKNSNFKLIIQIFIFFSTGGSFYLTFLNYFFYAVTLGPKIWGKKFKPTDARTELKFFSTRGFIKFKF